MQKRRDFCYNDCYSVFHVEQNAILNKNKRLHETSHNNSTKNFKLEYLPYLSTKLTASTYRESFYQSNLSKVNDLCVVITV